MPPDLRLAHTSVVTSTGQRVDVSVQPEGRHCPGRALRWRGGVYDVELPEAKAVKLLQLLLAHFAAPETSRPSRGIAFGGQTKGCCPAGRSGALG
ncbi:MAG: hypothetical protein K2X74_12810 [Acetobacteraceae bacterium]|nr:hypothetical protein [Acetobacteraceae bacterium]